MSLVEIYEADINGKELLYKSTLKLLLTMATLGIYNLKPMGFTQENIQVVKHHSKSLYIIPDFFF